VKTQPISLIALLCAFALAAGAAAQDTGAMLYSLKTAQVTGEFTDDPFSPNIPVLPDTGIACDFSVRNIDEHRAGADLTGWHIDFVFTHPQELSGKLSAVEDFFWDNKTYTTPFTVGYQSVRSYFKPFDLDPVNYRAIYDDKVRTLSLQRTNGGSMTTRTYQLRLGSDGQLVEVSFVKVLAGKLDTELHCTGNASQLP
jgi:hypothetical protein